MRTNKKTCEVAIHFNTSENCLEDHSFVRIEHIISSNNVEKILLTREAHWRAQLRTFQTFGLNKRQEYKSKNHIQHSS